MANKNGRIQEAFIRRYINAIRKYFDAPGCDRDGRMIRNSIIDEYQKILIEEFGMTQDEVSEIYQKEYAAKYFVA